MIGRVIFPIFIVLIIVWIFFATARTFGYLNVLLFTDLEKASANDFLDPEYKKMLILSEKIKKSEKKVFVYSTTEGREFFLLRYFAYPKHVYWYEEDRYPRDISAVYIVDN